MAGELTLESIKMAIEALRKRDLIPLEPQWILLPESMVEPYRWSVESKKVQEIGNYALYTLDGKFRWIREKGYTEIFGFRRWFPKWIHDEFVDTELKTTKAMRKRGAPKKLYWSEWNKRFPRLEVSISGW